MNNIKIIYDTMNDLPENIDGKYDIDMLPTTIIFQGKEYKAGVDIDNDEFYKLLRDNKEIPTTSQVTYMTFKETFEKYVKEGKRYYTWQVHQKVQELIKVQCLLKMI